MVVNQTGQSKELKSLDAIASLPRIEDPGASPLPSRRGALDLAASARRHHGRVHPGPSPRRHPPPFVRSRTPTAFQRVRPALRSTVSCPPTCLLPAARGRYLYPPSPVSLGRLGVTRPHQFTVCLPVRCLLLSRCLLPVCRLTWRIRIRGALVGQAPCELCLPRPLAYRHLAQRAVQVHVATKRREVLFSGEP